MAWDDNHRDIEHESYGLLSLSRVSSMGSRMALNLFASSVQHYHTIMLRISRAKLIRDEHGHRDWFSDKDQLIEIEMSPAQFAEAITSLNAGVGTPCTIRYINGERMPDCPHINKRQEFDDEFKAEMTKLAAGIGADQKRINDILTKKSLNNADRKEIQEAVAKVRNFIESHMPFLHTQWNEAADRIVTEAKGEAEAFMTHMIHSAGLEALAGKVVSIPSLENKAGD